MFFLLLSLLAGTGVLTALMLAAFVRFTRPAPYRHARPLKIAVVLGSGGHTAELIAALRALPAGEWAQHRPFYVVAATDRDSEAVATDFERETASRVARVLKIPRAREVGQSYATSVFTTLRALLAAFGVALRERPDVILTNGPGVCVPVVFAGIATAVLLRAPRPSVAYFESFTCVDHLSLSGKILLRVADVFTVQWPQLARALRVAGTTAQAPSRVLYTGPFPLSSGEAATSDRLVTKVSGGERRLCVVTVGSTKFDALMEAIDTPAFFAALASAHGITRVLIQRGRSAYAFKNIPSSGDGETARVGSVDVTVVAYKPFLQKDVRAAALVISHAGAGTILEALGAAVPCVVVPNEALMGNHQAPLADALSARRHLFVLRAADLVRRLPELDLVTGLRPLPPPDTQAMRVALALAIDPRGVEQALQRAKGK